MAQKVKNQVACPTCKTVHKLPPDSGYRVAVKCAHCGIIFSAEKKYKKEVAKWAEPVKHTPIKRRNK